MRSSEPLQQYGKKRNISRTVEPRRSAPDSEAKGVHWVNPKLVAEVRFAEWTKEGLLRQASFLGLRKELIPALRSVHFAVRNINERLSILGTDPWGTYREVHKCLTKNIMMRLSSEHSDRAGFQIPHALHSHPNP